ncbi:uncharacterized protein LOC141661258 [Apium graveolens]|uniref:uncharacterized protein LOC141661258 n=1 Tax=Apium graveolens TaxID=4045 RepID=UPI003D79B6DB
MQNPNSLVARVYKERYFPDVHVLKATQGQGSSFIWAGIWAAKEEFTQGFRWLLGSSDDIVATTDPWLKNKVKFRLEHNQLYTGKQEKVSSLFLPGKKEWNTILIKNNFLQEDAEAILASRIPQRTVADRMVWAHSSNGIYTAKAAYHFWYEANFGSTIIPQCTGWKKIWHLNLPHKIKVFVWRFCQNVIPVRRRLSSKGLRIPITFVL